MDAPSSFHLPLDDRTVVRIAGEDARSFLQDVITNDVAKVAGATAVYAALLTPQGKVLHDFFLVADGDGDGLLMDCEHAGADDLLRRLRMYRLRARVTIEPDQALSAFALVGAAAAGLAGRLAGGVVYADPRLAALGARAALPHDVGDALAAAGFAPGERAAYDALRLGLGVPDGSGEVAAKGSFALECGFEELHGVDFDKGCYVGQEVTARMKHRGLVRKRLLPVDIDGPPPPPGAAIERDGVTVGELRGVRGARGLAMLRLDRLQAAGGEGAPLLAGAARITAHRPDWMRL